MVDYQHNVVHNTLFLVDRQKELKQINGVNTYLQVHLSFSLALF